MKSIEQLNSISRRSFLGSALAVGAALASPAEAQAPFATAVQRPPDPFPRTPHSVRSSIHVNQVGFLTAESKRAVVVATSKIPNLGFVVVDDAVTPRIRFKGMLTPCEQPASTPAPRGSQLYEARFDELATPGRYRVRLSDGTPSVTFTVDDHLYPQLIPLIHSYFEVQRCGSAKSLGHAECHRDDGIALNGPRAGAAIDGAGGWHDAGDYLKFVTTTSYVTAVMLSTYSRYPQLFRDHRSGARLPTLLAQAKVGLDWLMKMHPAPGEFYYQIGDAADHDRWRLPEQDCTENYPKWKPRTAHHGIGANLAGRTSASLAMAARIYGRFDREYAATCLRHAVEIFELGVANPITVSSLPADFYAERTWTDDMELGAVALFEATGDQAYLRRARDYSLLAGPAHDGLSVYNMHALAHSMLIGHVGGVDRARLVDYLRQDAEILVERSQPPYFLASPYSWGTAANAAGAAVTCQLYAAVASPADSEKYLKLAQSQRDYILGCNPFGRSFLIGAGVNYPQFPHHQIANLRSLELAGALIGGPADVKSLRKEKLALDDCDCSDMTAADPATYSDDLGVYRDAAENYVTNEPANDYTVNFLLMASFWHSGRQLKKGDRENALQT